MQRAVELGLSKPNGLSFALMRLRKWKYPCLSELSKRTKTMTDPFKNRAPNLNGPATDIIPVIPSDMTDFISVALALYVEAAGTISFVAQSGENRTVAVTDFALLPVGARRVNASGTTASGIHALVVG
jgi:hypothetical protein